MGSASCGLAIGPSLSVGLGGSWKDGASDLGAI